MATGAGDSLHRIFISYSTQHRDLTESLAEDIEAQFGAGSVWWDRAGLRSGDRFSPEITKALDAAQAVVVVWTPGAVASDWVYAEAVRAANQGKVVTVRAPELDRDEIPLPFNVYHTEPTTDRVALLDAIAKRLAGEKSEQPSTLSEQGFRSYLVEPRQEDLPAKAASRSPASLLLAKHRLVSFTDFHGLCPNFVTWALDGGERVRGRLVHGPAGLGKTRALIEIADTLTKDHGWLAGFVPRDVRGRETSEAALERLILKTRDVHGLMLIVDYAESRQEDVVWLADRLMRRSKAVAAPARLVLLSRSAGDWWRERLLKSQSLQYLCSLGANATDEIAIPQTVTVSDRHQLFKTSVQALMPYRAELTRDASSAAEPSDMLWSRLTEEDDYDRPLAVQIEALLHVAGVAAAPDRSGMAHLLDRICGLEYAHWEKTLDIDEEPNLQDAMRHGVAQVTLVGRTDNVTASTTLLARNPLFNEARDIDVRRARDMLSRIVPDDRGDLAGLEPDLIGEHHVARTATDDLIDACLAWAGNNVDTRRNILTVLNRATREEHGPAADRPVAQLERLVLTRSATLGADLIAVAVETPGRLLAMCPALETQLDNLDAPALAAINDALPDRSIVLMELSLAVAVRSTQEARSSLAAAQVDAPRAHRETLLSRVAGCFTWISHHLANPRRRRLDTATNQEVTDIHLSAHLAACVDTLGNRLSILGRHEAALAASEEAVALYRSLAQQRPDTFLPHLAASLGNLGSMHTNLERHEAALAASQEAVDIRRRLARAQPETLLPDLALSLTNLGVDLANLGQHDAAREVSQESVEINRQLARTRPDEFLPHLATSLNNLGGMLASLGRHEAALAASQEAVDIRRRLVHARPDAFMPDLAASLNNLGNRLSNLRRHEEALAAGQEAVDIRRHLAQARPDVFLSDLASSLNNLSNRLSSLRRYEAALEASEEAIGIRRRLVQARPDAGLPGLASSLTNYGQHLTFLERYEPALAACEEAVAIYRNLAQARSEAFVPNLARSLGGMSMVLATLERHAEAVQALTEALERITPLVELNPEAHRDVVKALQDAGRLFFDKAGLTPNDALLLRVTRALGDGEAGGRTT